jgi:hypothetical protein
MRILSLIAVLGGCLLMNPEHSFAQVGPKQQQPAGAGQALSRVTPEQVATALTQAGIRSQVVTQENTKIVRMTIGQLKTPAVFFSDCNNQGCGNLEFAAFFSADPSWTADGMNNWNSQWRYAKASLDTDGSVTFQMDVLVTGGLTLENIKENGKIFAALLNKFLE